MDTKSPILLICLAVVLVAAGVLTYLYYPKATPTAQLNAALYPLYTDATWGSAVATTSPDYGPVAMVQSVPVSGITDIAGLATPFTQYYHDKLTAAGWTQDMSREAGGPGAESSVYTHDGQFVVVSFQSVFSIQSTDAPEACPCTVHFTLMSGAN